MPHSRPSGRLLVRGSINIDEFFTVDHIVRSGETIASSAYSRRAGGKGANQAVAASKAGAAVDFAGVIGQDGEWLRECLGDVGLSLLVTGEQVPTGRALIQVSASTADNSIVLLPGANFSPSASTPHPRLSASTFSAYTHLLLQNEIPLEETKRALREAHSAGVVTLFNPSPMLPAEELERLEWESLDWLFVNAGEAEELLDALAGGAAAAAAAGPGPEEVLRALRQTPLLSALTGIIMTVGADGVRVSLRRTEDALLHVPAGEVVHGVKDTTGAGDCFSGYFAALLAALPVPARATGHVHDSDRAGIESCLVVASQAAAMCVERPGAMESVPTLQEVIERLGDRWHDLEKAFVDPEVEAGGLPV